MRPYEYPVPFSSRTGNAMLHPQDETDWTGVTTVDDCAAHGIADCSKNYFHHSKQIGQPVVHPVQWRENIIFPTTMQIQNYATRSGGGNVYLHSAADVRYPMFVSDFVNMCREGTVVQGSISGRWRMRKHGNNYGVMLWTR